jgi:hypothetical protein
MKEGDGFSECFMSKYYGQKVTLEQTEAYLSLFFFDGESINVSLMQRFIDRL